MLTLRLARVGKKKQAFYKLIVSEKTRDTYGTYLEALGSLNPHTNPSTLAVKKERIEHWLKQGATMSPTVNNLLIEHKIISGDKVKVWKPKKKVIENPPAGGPAAAPKAEATKETPKAETKPVEAPKTEQKEDKLVKAAKETPTPETAADKPTDRPEVKVEAKPEPQAETK